MLKRLLLVALATTIFLPSLPAQALSGTDFNASRIIDDRNFFTPNTLSIQEIQQFLNAKVPVCDTNGTQMHGSQTRAEYSASAGYPAPFTCLRDYRQNAPSRPFETGLCRGYTATANQSAAEMIYWIGDSCGISSQVLLVLLQKEQSLITDDWPWSIQYRSATGYGCPDTAACDSEYYGFFNQVYAAARQFKKYAQSPSQFNYTKERNNFIQYNPNSSCGGSTVYIENQATAGLYNYTPYQPNSAALANIYGSGDSCSAYGNRNFWRQYNEWFGPPTGWYCPSNSVTGPQSKITFGKIQPKIDHAILSYYSDTASRCVETHEWKTGFTAWNAHTSSNLSAISLADNSTAFADLNGDGKDEPVLISYRNTGSGNVEFHVWNSDMRSWQAHIASNLPAIDPANFSIQFADLNGDGKDEPVLISYRNTGSGNVEFHVWNSDMRSWQAHIASNLPAIDPANFSIQFADLNGDGKDEPVLISYRNTGSGNVEFHVWNSDMRSWQAHIASNLPAIDPANFSIQFADLNGDGKDEGVLVSLKNTGSGNIEFHTWNPGFGSWQSHTSSNQSTP